MISITVQNLNNTPVITICGRIDTGSSDDFSKALQSLSGETKSLVLDFSQCHYLSSSGIRVLIVAAKKAAASGGKMLLASVQAEVFQVLEMAGLDKVFAITADVSEAIQSIMASDGKSTKDLTLKIEGQDFQFQCMDAELPSLIEWEGLYVAGYEELGVSAGYGAFAETHDENELHYGLFVSCRKLAACLPDAPRQHADFRIPKDPAIAGMYVRHAVSFTAEPNGLVYSINPVTVPLNSFAEAVGEIKERLGIPSENPAMTIIINADPEQPSLSMVFHSGNGRYQNILNKETKHTHPVSPDKAAGTHPGGILLRLESLPENPAAMPLQDVLSEVLTFENIMDVGHVRYDDLLVNPAAWVYLSRGSKDASSLLPTIVAEQDDALPAHEAFLCRSLYEDSSRIVLTQLQGGFSAKTYQVESFDHEGRKLRPTVLKTATRETINREAERCRKYAMPYILNNSAMVLGTASLGNTGMMRYNFVGIGGENSRLSWLYHYYRDWPIEQLEPLFNTIFMDILKPWYGQVVRQQIYPFRDHDPTTTFFPHIFKTAEEVLSVSADRETITAGKNKHKILNPFWFLKHEFKQRHNFVLDYYTAICHGDLNMQNILLDEKMNVYLIDFSETKPRSAISDFARLEDIFMLDCAPLENRQDLDDLLEFLIEFYSQDLFGDINIPEYSGRHSKALIHNVKLALKMREYALTTVMGDSRTLPYYLALLEWMIPIVCYRISWEHKYASMVASGILCEKIRELL
ncbi:MAG: anti-sigma factor antagonist [Bacteroidales bacterium]|nr:anti-sigma factor antagonist [Bacteroidales bacterium]